MCLDEQLYTLAQKLEVTVIHILLKHGARITKDDDNMTALMIAAANVKTAVVTEKTRLTSWSV